MLIANKLIFSIAETSLKNVLAVSELLFRPLYVNTNELGTYPLEPVSPVKPVNPVSPVKPVNPVNPVAPVAPVKPVSPVAPVTPVEGPGGPEGPVGPVSPFFPPELVLQLPIWNFSNCSLSLLLKLSDIPFYNVLQNIIGQLIYVLYA